MNDLRALKAMPLACVMWPSEESMVEFSRRITRKHPTVRDRFGWVDGTLVPVGNGTWRRGTKASDYYSGRKKKNCVNNIFVLTPDGCFCYAAVGIPGATHDSFAMGTLHDIVLDDESMPRPFGILGDSAFPHTDLYNGRIQIPDGSEAIARCRVSVEWGMHGWKGRFQRFRTELTCNDVKRKLLLSTSVLLHNVMTRVDGVSQIRSCYYDDEI